VESFNLVFSILSISDMSQCNRKINWNFIIFSDNRNTIISDLKDAKTLENIMNSDFEWQWSHDITINETNFIHQFTDDNSSRILLANISFLEEGSWKYWWSTVWSFSSLSSKLIIKKNSKNQKNSQKWWEWFIQPNYISLHLLKFQEIVMSFLFKTKVFDCHILEI
jgi:hypothetical protein